MPRMWKRNGVAMVALGFLLSAALAVQEELLEQARKLVAEAKPFIEKANDVDLEMGERRAPRKEAFTRLKAAREAYDKYLDANPSMEEKLDKEYCDVAALLYWIKKDSGLGELEKDSPQPTLPGGEDRAAKAPEWKDKPTPGTEPAGGSSPAAPTDAERAKRQFAAILDYEKKNPGDLPVLLKFYEQFLADFGDPSLPEYAQAVEKLGKINDRMRGVLKEVAKRDPDTISGAESKEEKSIFGRLSQDFNAKDPEIRRRAAKLMAASRTRSATYFLARGLADKDTELAGICREGLVAIGGSSTGENLVKLYRDASKEKQQAAVDVLSEITKKGPVDGAAESVHIGRFALSNDPDVASSAVNLLVAMGRPGGPGLLVALDSKIVEKKVAAMDGLAAIRWYRSATRIGDFLVTGDGHALETLRAAAIRNLKSMGTPVIPYMIPLLSSGSRQYAALTMREITGAMIGMNNPRAWRQWCDEHAAEVKDE
jgi:hypothetical protein